MPSKKNTTNDNKKGDKSLKLSKKHIENEDNSDIDNDIDNENKIISSDTYNVSSNDVIKFVIVEKNGELKNTEMKGFSVNELYKKCKFKKPDGFDKKTEWTYNVKNDGKFIVELWAKDDGMANQENKYDFPPPVDHDLYFGACVLFARDMNNNIIDLTVEKWNKVYEFLFGGFDSIIDNEEEDDEEEDELETISKKRKTKDGYLKDGFVVDRGESDDESCGGDGEDCDDDDSDEDSDDDDDNNNKECDDDDDSAYLTEGSSELSEEEYEYDSE